MSEQTLPLAGLRPEQIKRLAAMRDGMLGWTPDGFVVERISDGAFIGYDGSTGIERARIADRVEAEEWMQQQIDDDKADGSDDTEGYRLLQVYRKDKGYDAGPVDETPLSSVLPYTIATDNLTAAIAQIVTAFRAENAGIGKYRAVCHDGTVVTIDTDKKPPKKRPR